VRRDCFFKSWLVCEVRLAKATLHCRKQIYTSFDRSQGGPTTGSADERNPVSLQYHQYFDIRPATRRVH
jgi:hypothetical protein